MSDLRKKIQTKDKPYSSSGSGGDMHAESWDMYFSSKEMLDSGFCVYKAGDDGPMVFLIHGAGLGAMSWAPVVKLLKDHCRVITFDCRGHGSTLLTEDDMSSENLVNDTKGIIEKLNPTGSPIVLIGHSMGGAIAIRTALALPKNAVSALIVLDVVEGTAMAALPKMMSIIQGRPSKFDTVESALHWAVSSGVVRNRASACISVPQQFIEKDGCYVWRTDLRKTQPFWEGWFKNMSNLFLSVPCPKLLLVADTDRLDTPLTTGQMMGKFQFSIIPNVGHLIQEDAPERTATLIIQFLQRFRLTK